MQATALVHEAQFAGAGRFSARSESPAAAMRIDQLIAELALASLHTSAAGLGDPTSWTDAMQARPKRYRRVGFGTSRACRIARSGRSRTVFDRRAMRLSPHFDLSETDNALEIRMDAPGLKPADIDIQVSGNVLTLSGERKEEQEERGRTFHRVERRSGSFSRSVMLPCTVQEDKIEAKYADGVLAVVLPKTEAARSRKIKVQS